MAARDKRAMQAVLDALAGRPVDMKEIPYPPHKDGSANIPFMEATAAAIAGHDWAVDWCFRYLADMLEGDFGLGYSEPLSPIYMESKVACCDGLDAVFRNISPVADLARRFYLAARAYQSLGTMRGTYPSPIFGWAGRALRRWQGSTTLLAGDRGEIYPWSASTICLGKELGIGRWRGGKTPRRLNFTFWPSWIQDICREERGEYLLDGEPYWRDLFLATLYGDGLFVTEDWNHWGRQLPPLRTRAQWVEIPGVGRAGWIDKGRNPNTRPLLGWVAEYRPNGEVGKVTQLMPHRFKRNYGKRGEDGGRCWHVCGEDFLEIHAETSLSKRITGVIFDRSARIAGRKRRYGGFNDVRWVEAETVL